MRTLLLWFTIATTVFAAHVEDRADLMTGAQEAQLEQTLQSTHVWVETDNSLGSDLKSYGDRRVKEVTNRGFIIVVSMNPKGWRISMNPIGLVSGQQTQVVGNMMAAKFKERDFAGAFLLGAKELESLIAVKETPPPAARQSTPPPPATEPFAQADDSSSIAWFVLVIAGALVAAAIIIAIMVKSARKQAQADEARREALESLDRARAVRRKEQQERERIRAEQLNQKFTVPQESFRPDPAIPKLSVREKHKSERLWNKTTPHERQKMADRYRGTSSYDPNIDYSNNQFLFYMLMMSNNDIQATVYSEVSPSGSSHFTTPSESRYTPPPKSDDDDDRRRSSSSSSSSSYDSSSSSSYDSGGSSGSFDSGSSSDSGGSSGGFD